MHTTVNSVPLSFMAPFSRWRSRTTPLRLTLAAVLLLFVQACTAPRHLPAEVAPSVPLASSLSSAQTPRVIAAPAVEAISTLLLAKEADRDPRDVRFACEWAGNNLEPGLTYHVSPSGKDVNDGLSLRQSFATLQKAADVVKPGGTVLVYTGTYSGQEGGGAVLRINTSATERAPITFRAAPGELPVIQNNTWQAIHVADASYIIIEGFELVGRNDSISLQYALEHKTDKSEPHTNSQGVMIWNYETGGRSHHVIVRGNRIHDFGGSAVNGSECDCITIAENVMYRNGFYSVWGGSGVIIWQPRTLVQAPGYKLVIRGNRVFDIWNYVPYADLAEVTEPLTSAAIFLDLFTKHGFAGPSLVEGNIVYRNQACGIQNYQTINVDVVNNTLFQNLLSAEVDWGEYCDFRSHGSRVINNIFVASEGRRATFVRATIPDAFFSHNLYWPRQAAVAKMGEQDRYGDPKFISLLEPTEEGRVLESGWDFSLGEGSEALDNADAQSSPLKDAQGRTRAPGTPPDRGALEK